MRILKSELPLAVTMMRNRKHIVEITSMPNSKGELRCTTGGKTYSIHGNQLRPLTVKAREILRPFAASTVVSTSQKDS